MHLFKANILVDQFIMSVKPCYSMRLFCKGHFVMVPLNLTCLHVHGLQHIVFEHLFNLY